MDPKSLQGRSREDIIKEYFLAGLSYREILELLSKFHSVQISLRQLHRILRQEALFRRHCKLPINIVTDVIKELLQGSDNSLGYRSMHQRLRALGITTDRETVRLCLKNLDPEGVQQRSSNRLRRRKYVNLGSNFLWHIDGYDKLKPYGFPIHGAIDGFSRKILWLKVGRSNNDPKIVGSYFLETVEELSFVPRCIRADRGTENIVVAGTQRFSRRDCNDNSSGEHSFLFGTSTRNQRIESWWSILKKHWSGWWINFFKDFCDEGLDVSLPYHLDCVRFSFTRLLQQELDEVRRLWNNHRIRKVKNSDNPSGRPNVLFFAPQLSHGRDFKFPVSPSDLEVAREFTTPLSPVGCSHEMEAFGNIVMIEKQISVPSNADSAKQLFWVLVEEIDNSV